MAAQLGQAGFGLQLTVSYLSGGSPYTNTSTTALSGLSKVETDRGTVEVAGCIQGPPPDDLGSVAAEAIVVIAV